MCFAESKKCCRVQWLCRDLIDSFFSTKYFFLQWQMTVRLTVEDQIWSNSIWWASRTSRYFGAGGCRGRPELEFNWRLTPQARYFCNYISHSTSDSTSAKQAWQRSLSRRDRFRSRLARERSRHAIRALLSIKMANV